MNEIIQTMNVLEDSVFEMCGRVVVRQIGGDSLLVPISGPAAGGRVFPLNVSALTVWNCLMNGGTVCAASDLLVETYGIEREQAMSDCRECIGSFLDENLMEKKAA